MGVCVLGNYVEFPVPVPALLSLEDLLSWKLFKDTLNPMGTKSHPASETLPVIAGHLDGCATLCPGEYLYDLLDETRLLVETNMIACGYEPTGLHVDEEINPLIVYPNPAKQSISFTIPKKFKPKDISIVNLLGHETKVLLVENNTGRYVLDVNHLKDGIYYLRVLTGEKTFSGSFLITR